MYHLLKTSLGTCPKAQLCLWSYSC